MKSRKKHQIQVSSGLTGMTKREEKAMNGYGRSGNARLDEHRFMNGTMAKHVQNKKAKDE